MPQTDSLMPGLYEYDKLNTVSLFRRIITDIHGQQLHDWPDDTEGQPGKWRWLSTG